jgi:quercetin dioxygenase-like cupin family protein
MSAFFAPARERPEPPNAPQVNRASGDGHLAIDSAHMYRLLGGRSFNRELEPVLVTVAPCEEFQDASAHDGEEFVYVLWGRLVIIVDGEEYDLGRGDSIHYRSTVPHTYRNDTSEPAEALWVLTQRLF